MRETKGAMGDRGEGALEGGAFSGPYRLAVLGRVELTSIRGEAVRLPRGKPLAVLIFLAFHPEGVERDELAGLLWGEKELARGRQSVRQALSQLRKDLGPEIFATEEPVRLVSGVVQTDFQELRDAVEKGALEAALQVWRGEPLTGLSAFGPSWKEWAEELADSCKRILVVGLEERALAAVGRGELDQGVEELKRAAALVPQRVETWAHLIEVSYRRRVGGRSKGHGSPWERDCPGPGQTGGRDRPRSPSRGEGPNVAAPQ